MTVTVVEDLRTRKSGKTTWLEAGIYEVVRELPDDRYLIIIKDNEPQRLLTIIRKEETL